MSKKNWKFSSESYKKYEVLKVYIDADIWCDYDTTNCECYLEIEAFEMKLGPMSFACSAACPHKIK